MTKFFNFLLILCVTLLFSGCAEPEPHEKRLEAIMENEESLKIALTWPIGNQNHAGTKTSIKQGVEMAAREINDKGGLLGRKIEVAMHDDERSVNVGLDIAREIAVDSSIFAVIGHLDSYISVPAAATYDRAGIINLNPGSADPSLTGSNRLGIVRLIPDSGDQGRRLARHLAEKNFVNVALYYVDNAYGKNMANSFEAESDVVGLNISDRRSYQKVSKDHDRVFGYWSDFLSFDAIVLIASMPEGNEVVASIRRSGITVPIFAAPGIDTASFAKNLVDDDEVYVMSYFHRDLPREKTQDFVQQFREFAGAYPSEASSALGYDAVHILAFAVEKTRSFDREKLIEALKGEMTFNGAAGEYSFNSIGEPIDKLLTLNAVKNEVFVLSELIN